MAQESLPQENPDENQDASPPPPRSVRFAWFPKLWVGAAVIVTAVFALTDATRDYKVSVAMISFGLALVGWVNLVVLW